MIRPIPGWPGYHVDDEGRVYSTRHRVRTTGLTFGTTGGGPIREKRQFDRRSARGKATPYRSVCLSRDGRHENKYVHELVALAFLGPRPDGAEILHGAEGSRVNRLSNLPVRDAGGEQRGAGALQRAPLGTARAGFPFPPSTPAQSRSRSIASQT